MASKKATQKPTQKWLEEHRSDASIVDGVSIGSLAQEVLRLKEQVSVLETAMDLAELSVRAAGLSAQPEPPQEAAPKSDDTDDLATALYAALQYLDEHEMACLYLFGEETKAPLLCHYTLRRVLKQHAWNCEMVFPTLAAARGLPEDAALDEALALDADEARSLAKALAVFETSKSPKEDL